MAFIQKNWTDGPRRLLAWPLLGGLLLASWTNAVAAIDVTLLHTNDLHSHFHPDRQLPELGGIARLKTRVDALRASRPGAVLLLDGGDWSEGSVYYNLATGAETLELMDQVGYDFVVAGNHDWLNGPGHLLRAVEKAAPRRMTLLATNVDTRAYADAARFKAKIPRYAIREIDGVRIAFIGVVTDEGLYDKFLSPVRILDLTDGTRALVRTLKTRERVDVVVAISHNSIKNNVKLLENVTDIDLVIGAHDHEKLMAPVAVRRTFGSTAWIVEAGQWGHFLGDLQVRLRSTREANQSRKPRVELVNYQLHQMDVRTPENPEIARRVQALDALLEAQYGPIFHDSVGETHVEIDREGQENLMGNFATDAYLASVPEADFALDHVNFLYNGIARGTIRSVDLRNAVPAVFNPETGKTWTIKTFRMKGSTLSFALNVIFGARKLMPNTDFLQGSLVSTSGLSFVYKAGPVEEQKDRWKKNGMDPKEPSALGFAITDLKVRGQPIDPDRSYTVVAGQGILEAIEYVNKKVPGTITIERGSLKDTGIETWQALLTHLKQITPVTLDKISVGRISTLTPDLAVYVDDLAANLTSERLVNAATGRTVAQAQVRVRIRNLGTAAVPAKRGVAQLLGNENGLDQTTPERWLDAAQPQEIPALAPGEEVVLTWNAQFPGDFGFYPLTVRLVTRSLESNLSNNEVTRWIASPR